MASGANRAAPGDAQSSWTSEATPDEPLVDTVSEQTPAFNKAASSTASMSLRRSFYVSLKPDNFEATFDEIEVAFSLKNRQRITGVGSVVSEHCGNFGLR